MLRKLLNILRLCFARFGSQAGGNVALIFALCSPLILVAAGGAVDLARAFNADQKLTQVANLACQYASRPSIIQTATSSYSGANGGTTYVTNVTNFIATSLTNQAYPFTQTNASPFSYTQGGAANVSLASTVPTVFVGLMNIHTIPIAANAHCYDSPNSISQRTPDANSPYIVHEGFENTSVCPSGYCWIDPSGHAGAISTPRSTFPSSGGYTGSNGAAWYITGYCIEIDHVGIIRSTVPEGNFSAELDCDNGGGQSGNSSISTSVYLPTGSYELRYNYASRVDYPDYNPTYICGSTNSDSSWANSTNSSGGPVANALRTNQVNVYLDANSNGAAPLHTTIDGTQKLAGSNLIDQCVYSTNWVERTVAIAVTTAGYYWLSFAADGQNDSYGAQVDNIRLCSNTCPGTVQDNFPPTWLASSGANPTLFEDTFEAPTWTATSTNSNLSAVMDNSTGTSGASSGWPSQTASGWATGPYNIATMVVSSTYAQQGKQAVQLDANRSSTSNQSISRSFLLDPGYYQITYEYISDETFASLSTTPCTTAPTASQVATYNVSGTASGKLRYNTASTATLSKNTNIVGLFMYDGQSVSTPIGGGSAGSQTSFNNPDGSTSTTPTVSPYGISLTSYDATQLNPLLDICGYASTWQLRTVYVEIDKPGLYWLTFAALGSADKVGGAIDDVKLSAYSSLYGAAPSSGLVVIPTPTPTAGTTASFSGYSIIVDPKAP
jgi:Flp pilus assembly protein TadG